MTKSDRLHGAIISSDWENQCDFANQAVQALWCGKAPEVIRHVCQDSILNLKSSLMRACTLACIMMRWEKWTQRGRGGGGGGLTNDWVVSEEPLSSRQALLGPHI